MNINSLKQVLDQHNIYVHSVEKHTKASENYVDVTFKQDDGFEWKGLIPYYYRRTGVLIEKEDALIGYLISIKPHFEKSTIESWIKNEIIHWDTFLSSRTITKPFFDALSKLRWTSDFPQNANPQRRIQDIKEMGYTIATKRTGRKTERLLVPIPRGVQTGYETLSNQFRAKALKALNFLNIYELSSANKTGLLPDHKFPEIRWDAQTRTENFEDMSPEDIKNKFQLLDNQRNQQKREICRKCFQTGKRGTVFGINFFYAGNGD